LQLDVINELKDKQRCKHKSKMLAVTSLAQICCTYLSCFWMYFFFV